MNKEQTVLVLGASGMLGNAVLRLFSNSPEFAVFGTIRSATSMSLLPQRLHEQILCGINADNDEELYNLFEKTRPAVVINCVGVVKQLAEAGNPLAVIPINSLLPHRLARLCGMCNARFIHVSTDCVFGGTKGMYREGDFADANDLYGRSKFLGEVGGPQAVTLRTSIIGPELNSAHGLLGWFLSQRGRVRGFTRAVFSGLPTVELARVMRDFVIPRENLRGVYHVSSAPITKYELLTIIAEVYEHSIDIQPDDTLVIDRSLDSERFRRLTGYDCPAWPELVRSMHEFG